MTVHRLLAESTSRELAEWQAYFRLVAAEEKQQERKAKNKGGRGSALGSDIGGPTLGGK